MRISQRIGGALCGLFAATAAQAADMPVKAKAAPPSLYTPTPWVNVFAGFAVDPDSYFGDAGAVFAFNHNLYSDGWLFRLRGGAGRYEYNRAIGLEQSASFQVAEFMIGYQKYWGATRVSGYVGANYEHHSNSDPLATIRGSEWGVKAQGEIYTPITDNAYFFALGTISSVYSGYFVLGKVGYFVAPNIAVGPELVFLGNDRFDAVRLGPFIAFDINPSAQIILSGGYSWDTNSDWLNDHSGGYFTVHVRANY